MRVFFAAVAFTALSFVVGVAGDLSAAAPRTSGPSVTLRIPPPIPADAPRAAPLPILATRAASAGVVTQTSARAPVENRVRAVEIVVEPEAEPKPHAQHMLVEAAEKVNEASVAKAKEQKSA